MIILSIKEFRRQRVKDTALVERLKNKGTRRKTITIKWNHK